MDEIDGMDIGLELRLNRADDGTPFFSASPGWSQKEIVKVANERAQQLYIRADWLRSWANDYEALPNERKRDIHDPIYVPRTKRKYTKKSAK